MAASEGTPTAATRQHLALLARVPLFSGVPRSTLEAIARAAREVAHPAGHAIVREGSTAHALHLVVEGTATVSIGGEAVARLGPGDFFGELAVLDEGLRSATVIADTPVSTLAVEGAAFRRLLDADARLARRLLVALAARVRELDRRLYD